MKKNWNPKYDEKNKKNINKIMKINVLWKCWKVKYSKRPGKKFWEKLKSTKNLRWTISTNILKIGLLQNLIKIGHF